MRYRKLPVSAARLSVTIVLVLSIPTFFTTPAVAQGDKDCEALMKQIDGVADKLAEASQHLGEAEARLDVAEGHLKSDLIQSHPEQRKSIENSINGLKNSIASLKSSIPKLKLSIANLVEKLCACCGKKSEHASKSQPRPTPSTTDKVTDVLRTIGSHVSIGIGGGTTGSGGHDHHDRVRGEDRTKTAEKLSDHKTHTTKTPSSTKGKTVTSACKCHPCTCSPCTCH